MLRINRLTDYGIVLMARMAADPLDRTHNARDLAEATRLPLPMVSKVLKALARGGMLASLRGSRGGYRLARAAEIISVAEIIAALQGPIAITECTGEDGDVCGIESTCPCRGIWHRVNDSIRAALEGIRLSEFGRPRRAVGGSADSPGRAESLAARATFEER
jgi:FeS assembly SUF system regulator